MVFVSRMCENTIDTKRRRFLLSVSAATLGVGALGAVTGCGGGMNNPDGSTGDAGADGSGGGGARRVTVGGRELVDTGLTVADLPAGQTRLLSSTDVDLAFLVARDGLGFYAMSMVCTHEGCLLNPPNSMNQIDCQCNHGSLYGINGNLLQPARTRPVANQASLKHYQLVFEGTGPTARIFIDPNAEETNVMTRTPAP
jgi:Rieske Fe-S protein